MGYLYLFYISWFCTTWWWHWCWGFTRRIFCYQFTRLIEWDKWGSCPNWHVYSNFEKHTYSTTGMYALKEVVAVLIMKGHITSLLNKVENTNLYCLITHVNSKTRGVAVDLGICCAIGSIFFVSVHCGHTLIFQVWHTHPGVVLAMHVVS